MSPNSHIHDQELCDFIALELATFVSLHGETDNEAGAGKRALGFTVSFPVDQDPASVAIAAKWSMLSIDHDTVESFLFLNSIDCEINR